MNSEVRKVPQEKNRTIEKAYQEHEVGDEGWYVNLEMSMPGNFWNSLIFVRPVLALNTSAMTCCHTGSHELDVELRPVLGY